MGFGSGSGDPPRDADASARSARLSARASVASAAIALVAFGVAAYPTVWDRTHRPVAGIDAAEYDTGSRVTMKDGVTLQAQFDVAGTSKHLPAGSDVWVIIRATQEGRWYPVARVSGDSWTTMNTALRPAAGPQELYLYLVSIPQEQPLIDYVKRLEDSRVANKETDPGLSALPQGLVLRTVKIVVAGTPTS